MSNPVTVTVGARYRLERLLGRGGMGSVYRAYDRLTDQWVALKLVPVVRNLAQRPGGQQSQSGSVETVGLSWNALVTSQKRPLGSELRQTALAQTMDGALQTIAPGQSARVHVIESSGKATSALWARMALAQEFGTLAALRHPHIISVLDYGFVKQSQPFFTMELLENAQTLGLASRELPLAQRAQLLLQLLRALSYLHRHGILHRDLKSANVMVRKEGESLSVKLLDFGLARTRSHVQGRTGEIAGTLSYMAPELFQGQVASEATDLFAVGVIAYELFTGRHPFDFGDEVKLVGAIVGKEPRWEPLQPYPSLLSLLRRLLDKSPPHRPSADEALLALSAAVGVPLPQETVALRESTLQSARFVGREEPLSVLRAAMDTAQSGRGELRLLAGESGVGNSRLMEELRVYSLVQGVLSARGQAVSEGGAAYGVWREILRTLCLVTELDELSASVLKAILPGLDVLLQRTIPDAPALHPQAAQLRLINTIESLILSQSTPLLLLLEDIHWADAESQLLLRRLAPQCQSRQILIVASYRDDERPDLPQTLPGCPVLKLNRLSASSIAALCESMLGEQGCTPELVTFLEAETEGNVFFVIEVMRALAEEAGQLSLVASHRLPRSVLTGGIQAIVQRRLARLPKEARPLLQLAAVLGRQLDLAVLRCFEADLAPWLYLAADAAVLEVSGSTWRFAHDKIRESLILELNPTERQQIHLALASALEQTYRDSPAHAAVLAEHYQRGGIPTKAAFYLVEAGGHALSQGASNQAASLLEQALAPERRALLSKVQVARAYNGMVQSYMALGKMVPCAAVYEQFVTEFGIPTPVGTLSMTAMAGAVLAELLEVRRPTPPKNEEERLIWIEVVQATRWAFEAYAWAAQPSRSFGASLRGMLVANQLHDRALQSYFLSTFGYLTALIPLREASNQLMERAASLLAQVTNARAVLDVYRPATVQHLNVANWALARTELDRMIVLSRQVGDEYSLMSGLLCRMLVAVRLGEEALFPILGTELFARAQRTQSDQFARGYPIYQGLYALRRGDVEAAQRLFTEAEVYIQRTQDSVGLILLGGLWAHCLLLQGHRDAALRRAAETLAIVDSSRFATESVFEGLASAVHVYLALWEAGSAVERQRLAEPLRHALWKLARCAQVFPAATPRALLWHGRDVWNQGAFRTARYLGEASLRSAEKLTMPYDQALAREWLTRFANPPPGHSADWTTEPRGLWEILFRSLRALG